MEPAVKPAAATSAVGVIGVLATEATFQGVLYASIVNRHAAGAVIVEQAASGLASAVEEGRYEDATRLLRKYLAPIVAAGMDRLVLGCTHYPFVLDEIRAIVGPDVIIVDPSRAVARQVGRVARDAPVVSGRDEAVAGTDFYTTGDPGRFAARIEELLGEQAMPVRVTI
jgi:glutamate racemase